jgi:hypothetical protein
MTLGLLVTNPLAWLATGWWMFMNNERFQTLLVSFRFRPWHLLLASIYHFCELHAWIPWALAVAAIAMVLIRFKTCFYAFSEDYLFVQPELFCLSPIGGGPFSLMTDPIPFPTVEDTSASRGPIGLITGTGCLHVRSSDLPGGHIKITWVPHVRKNLDEILLRQGVRKARILSSM